MEKQTTYSQTIIKGKDINETDIYGVFFSRTDGNLKAVKTYKVTITFNEVV